MAKSLQARLKAANAKWKQGTEEAAEIGSFENLPDGMYLATLSGGEVKESQNGNLGMLTTFTVTEGDEEGETTTRWDGLEREDGYKWIAVYLRSLGVPDLDFDLTDLEGILENLVAQGATYRIQLKTKDEWQNLRVLKMVDEGEGYGEEAEAEEEDETTGEDASWAVGDRVHVDYEGEEYAGVITALEEDNGQATVQFDVDESELDYSWDDLTAEPEEDEAEEEEEETEEEEEEVEPKKGDAVVFEEKGKEVEGEVTLVSKTKKTVTIKVPKRSGTVVKAWDDIEILVAE